MSSVQIVLVALAGGTYLFKSAGPLLLGGNRQLPGWLDRLALILPAPLLGALVATSAFANGEQLVLDARVVGLVVAAIALKLKAPFVVVVLSAAVATALWRAMVGG